MEDETYELCKRIRHIVVIRAAEVMAYRKWSDQFAADEIRNIPKMIKDQSWFKPVDPSLLTAEQMTDLGFAPWSKDTPMRLIPLWLLPFLVDVVECRSIDGNTLRILRQDMDNDHRFGCLAYGVFPATTTTDRKDAP